MRELVSINGQICEPGQAKISVFDRGFLYGDSVYEVARSYGRTLFAIEDHVDRLYSSAEKILMTIPMSKEDMINELYRIYKTLGIADAYLRVVITRGEGPIALDPELFKKPNIVVFVKPLPPRDLKLYAEGMDVATAGYIRNARQATDPNTKSGNYLNNVMAMSDAKKAKVHDSILLNRQGQVTEGTLWNVFMVKGGAVITPPDEADILHGITRKTLKKICLLNSIKWEERFFTPEEMLQGDEAFATGTVREVLGIRTLDGKRIGSGSPGPLTLRLAGLYEKYVQDYCANFKMPKDKS